MQKIIQIALTLGILSSLCGLYAQDGRVADKYASAWSKDSPWDEFNEEAWDSAASMNGERIFGNWSDQEILFGLDYESEASLWGTKYAQETFYPRVDWLGPLFGGEGYTALIGVVPYDNADGNQMWIYGGWKYHLTSTIDVDIGGNIVISDKNMIGPGITNEFGWKNRGTIYLGLIGRMMLQPSIYGIYDFDLGQSILLIGIQPEYDFEPIIGVKGLVAQLKSSFGWLQANSWLGDGRTRSGNQWRNSFLYWETNANLIYEIIEGLEISAGVRYAGNNDGTGPNGIDGIDMGPDQEVWFGSSIQYGF